MYNWWVVDGTNNISGQFSGLQFFIKSQNENSIFMWYYRHILHSCMVNIRKKFRDKFSEMKIIASVFWDLKEILLVDFMPKGTTISADTYYETHKKLKKKWKRRGMLTYNVSLFHDNVRPHAARLIHDLLVSFGWDIVTHPSYSSQIIIFSIHWRSFWVDNDFQLKRRSRKLSKSGFRW